MYPFSLVIYSNNTMYIIFAFLLQGNSLGSFKI